MATTQTLAEQEHVYFAQTFLDPTIGERYSKAERITDPFAVAVIKTAGLDKKPTSPISVLDLASGTGVVSANLQKLYKELGALDKLQHTAGDFSPMMVKWEEKRIKEEGWKNAKAVRVNAEDTKLPDASFNAVMIGMALMNITHPLDALEDCYRILKPGGILATSTWFNEAWVEDIREAMKSIPGSPRFPQTSHELITLWGQGPWHEPNYVEASFHSKGFIDVKVENFSVHMPIHDAEDFCDIYKVFMDGIADRYWTQSEREIYGPLVRPAIIKFLNAKYGSGKSFTTERVAIMASGMKPV